MNEIKIHREGETRGVRWQIVSGGTYPGVRWRFKVPVDHLGATRWQESGGCFYDGCEDHPEGAVEWAARSVVLFLNK